uniref:Uncharacterized protein n=1 Tax=Rhizophora mucronata TaxID=61149 RepID=A0A2P2IHK3_RHIMU
MYSVLNASKMKDQQRKFPSEPNSESQLDYRFFSKFYVSSQCHDSSYRAFHEGYTFHQTIISVLYSAH